MLLGRVVKSNSHVDYVVQVFAPGEVPSRPGRRTTPSVASSGSPWTASEDA